MHPPLPRSDGDRTHRSARSHRRTATLLLAALPLRQWCRTTELLFGQCTRERIVVSLPVQVTRWGETRAATLTGSAGPGLDDYATRRPALIEGTLAQNPNVTWTVSAFGTSGSFIALSHRTSSRRLPA